MNRARFTFLLGLLPWAVSAAWAGTAADISSATAPMAVSGVYSLSFNLANIASTLPAGATITCKAKISPNPLSLGNQPAGAVPVETATATAPLAAQAANCAVEIPFSWTVNNAQSGVLVTYEIQAVAAASGARPLVRTTPPRVVGAAYPPAGARANLSFNVTF